MKRQTSSPRGEVPEAGTARARILSAAFQVLADRGYGAMHIRQIAARARVSKRELGADNPTAPV
jgi:AcrR family transcriptional regulator